MDALKKSPLSRILWGRVLAALVFGIVLIWSVIFVIQRFQSLPTPDNIERVRKTQIAAMESRWIGLSQSRQGLQSVFQNAQVPASQRLLINTSVFGMRLGGCLGPWESPVFDEAAATRFALASGARCLVLEIDHEQNSYNPVLIYRDSYGYKKSLNIGSIELVARQIAGRAFTAGNDSTPWAVASDPLILVLYFVRTPDAAGSPVEYTRFLGRVAEALQPLKNLVLGQTPQGDFRRQAQESQLFYQPLETLNKRIIILSNADTTVFRRLANIGLAGELGPQHDLDFLVHARLYSRESPSGLGITGQPVGTTQPACVITTTNYWLNTPPDRLADAISQTKKAWTLVMKPIATKDSYPNQEQIKKLLTTYGVQCAPITLFEKEDTLKYITAKEGLYEKTSWTAKPELIRYIPVPPVIVQKPIPQTNAGGGAIRTPF